MTKDGEVVPFGKYRGQPVEMMMADASYCEWALAQPWFRERFAALFAIIVNGGSAPIPFSNKSRAPALSWVEHCLRVTAFSACSMALDGVGWVEAAWLKPHWPFVVWPCDRIGAVPRSLPRVMLPLGARLGLRSLAAAELRRLELGAVLQYGEHDDGKSACERNPRLAHG